MLKGKMFISLLTLVIAVALIGGATLAWFTAEAEIEPNVFMAGTVGVSAGYSNLFERTFGTENCYIVEEERYAAEVDSYVQRHKQDGTAVDTNRSDPEVVLEDNADFFSLGFGGEIVVKFADPIVNFVDVTVDVSVTEETWGGNYPLETADVFASQDGINWIPIGEADNDKGGNNSQNTIENTFSLEELPWALYIKVVDTTDRDLHNSDADGFDVRNIKASNGYLMCDNINPGDCKRLCLEIENEGSKKMVFRVEPNARWINDELDPEAVKIALCGTDEASELCPGIECSLSGYNPTDWEIVLRDGGNLNDINDKLIYYTGDPLEEGETVELCLVIHFVGAAMDNNYQGELFVLSGDVQAIQSSNNAPGIAWADDLGTNNPYDYLLSD